MCIGINKIYQWLLMVVLLMVSDCSKGLKLVKYQEPASTSMPIRGVWLATVLNLDWPPADSLKMKTAKERIYVQKKGLINALDEMVKIGINTVFFQVKPDGTALWHSAILPWSDVLTGTVGKAPGYDPLAFMLREAHARGIKVHAWLNPYRVSMNTESQTVKVLENTLQSSPASVYAIHPDWIRTASGHFVLDPGLPGVRNWIISFVTEVVKHYSIDGIQFDDYFYNETLQSPLDDDKTYLIYGKNFANKANWRRNNTMLLIQQVSSTIKSLRPKIVFGVSPAGVWRNKIDDPLGSETMGSNLMYDTAYADIRQWVKLGLLDYIAPQLYWPFDHKMVKYDVITKWWADVVRGTSVQYYPGVALYKVGWFSATEPSWSLGNGIHEFKKQLDFNDTISEISGTILFRQGYLNQPQTSKVVEYLRTRWKTVQ